MSAHIIFHFPQPIVTEGTSGSTVRPFRMLNAFKQLGYEVAVVAGQAKERKHAIDWIKKKVAQGWNFQFAYAESSTMPTLLTEGAHLPKHPFLDFGFFKWLRNHEISVGLFYRDIHWRFDQYRNRVPWYKRVPATLFYWYDWIQYTRYVKHLFLPSLEMQKALPRQWPEERVSALPPGCIVANGSRHSIGKRDCNSLELLYVGGVTPPQYDLNPMFDMMRNVENVSLTVCCRKPDWERIRSYYKSIDCTKVRVVHAAGDELAQYYEKADLFLLIRNHSPYLDFSMPLKVFESLGYGVPIIATVGEGTSAQFISQEGVGWVVSTHEEAGKLLMTLRDAPYRIMEKCRHVELVRERHTWLTRAHTVASILTGGL